MEKKRYILTDKEGERTGTYTGKSPMQAAVKAARKGHKDIYLRQTKTKKILRYKGSREEKKVPVTEKSPQWMQDKAKNGFATLYVGDAEKIRGEE